MIMITGIPAGDDHTQTGRHRRCSTVKVKARGGNSVNAAATGSHAASDSLSLPAAAAPAYRDTGLRLTAAVTPGTP